MSPFPDVTVRVGCSVIYEALAPTPALFVMRPRRDHHARILEEVFSTGIAENSEEFTDNHGNIVERVVLMPGINHFRHDAFVSVSSEPDSRETREMLPIARMPSSVLRYTLPSRYCDSDKLLDFAWKLFGQIPHGRPRVQAICDWTHQNIEYRFGSGQPDLSASDIIGRRHGVCRDFAHVAIALCRTFNIPARYVTGHLPDIGHIDSGTPMDFHAYFEAFLGNDWFTFDARYNIPRIGRVKIAHGSDAVDSAFTTLYGSAKLTRFDVWAYQIPNGISLGDPVDLSKRLDGKANIRYV